MELIKLSLSLTSSLVTPLKGDTLFGQFCWGYHERYGVDELNQLLSNYTSEPNIIISDAFYHAYLPRPNYPFAKLTNLSEKHKSKLIEDRKNIKKKTLINTKYLFTEKKSLSQILQNILENGDHCVSLSDIKICADKQNTTAEDKEVNKYCIVSSVNMHNTINRSSGTTGSGEFAPYGIEVTSFSDGNKFDLYVLFNSNAISIEKIRQVLTDIGQFGYGADATIGMGKFELDSDYTMINLDYSGNTYLTLSPMVVDENIELKHSYYNLFTRFGRTGNIASFSANPFKKPISMLDTGALLQIKQSGCSYVGQGLQNIIADNANLSHPVYHQGYSIIIPLEI